MAEEKGVVSFPVPDEQTLRKMALYFTMRNEIRAGRRSADRRADDMILDDIGLNNWLDQIRWRAGGVANTHYLDKRS